MARSVLIISPHFPPSTLAGVHRARHLAKHLPAVGWTPLVVTVHEDHHTERLDPGLARLVPSGLEIVKVPAMDARQTRRLGLGDISLRAFPQIRRALSQLLSTQAADAVMITGAPYYTMPLAPWIQRRFGTPVVLDFQDPWVSAWGAARPALSKGGLSHRLACALEPRALKGAAFVTSVSDIQNQEMAARYPWLDSTRMAAIPIGCDPDDFTSLEGDPTGARSPYLAAEGINLSFVGTFMPRSAPLVRRVLSAFATARQAHPRAYERVRLNFIGTSNQPGAGTPQVTPLASAAGVADAVFEEPRRVPYVEALRALVQSAGILLIGSDERHYTASKIYPALMSGRRWLSLFHPESSAHHILSAAGGGIAVPFDTEAPEACEPEISAALLTLVTAPERLGIVRSEAYAPFTARSVAARFGSIFEQISGRA